MNPALSLTGRNVRWYQDLAQPSIAKNLPPHPLSAVPLVANELNARGDLAGIEKQNRLVQLFESAEGRLKSALKTTPTPHLGGRTLKSERMIGRPYDVEVL